MHNKVIQLYVYIYYFSDYFSYNLLQGIQYSSLCYIVGSCCLSVLCVLVCIG